MCKEFYMRSFIAILMAITLLASISADSVSAADGKNKIATISLQDIVEKSKAGQVARKQLEDELVKYQDALKQEQDALEAMKAEVEKKSSVWSAQVRDEKEREYQKKVREFQLHSEDAKDSMQQMEKRLMEPLLKDLHELLAEIGKRDGYTLILEYGMKGLRSRSGLLYADETLDISEMVRKELDARQKSK